MLLNNNFDGGVTGTTITTANSGFNGDAFTYVTTVNTGSLKYASVAANGLARPTAEYVLAVSTGTGTSYAACGWDGATLGGLTQFWTRFYIYFSSLVPNTGGDLNIFSGHISSSAPGVTLVVDYNSGTTPPYFLGIWNGFSSVWTSTTTPLVAGAWYRIEFRATLSTTVGTADLFLYAGANVDTTTATEHISQTAQNYGTSSADTASLGMDYFNQINTPAVYFSNWQINNTGYPGPAPFRQGLGSPAGNLANPVAIHSDIS
jgi:hypothetical protein